MQLRNKHITRKLWELDKFILEEYKLKAKEEHQDRDDALYEKEFKKRIKKAIKVLTPITDEATLGLRVYQKVGRKSELKPNEKLRLILIHQMLNI